MTIMNDVWVAIDSTTSRIVGFGEQSDAQQKANHHRKLSGNDTVIRKLREGWVVYEW